ncbi:MAG: TIGR01459 family HAD-type hydrolase [Alphaproteobacteria bacterium]
MQRIDSLLDIADSADTFFIDVFGVLWDGAAFYPKAVTVCEKLMEKGKRIYILSNTTTVSAHFKEKHIKNGFIQGVHYTDVISSGDVLKYKLENEAFMDEVCGSKKGKYLLIGRTNDQLLESVLPRQTLDVNEASAVYFGSLQEKNDNQLILYETTEKFEPLAQKALDRKLPAICSNPDYFAFNKGFRYVTQGNLAKWYEDHGGKVYWIGKPYKNIYDFALKKANAQPAHSIMVGDTIRTDILGGFNAGMKTVLIVGYGITQDKLNAGQTLEEVEKEEGATPDFILEGLK